MAFLYLCVGKVRYLGAGRGRTPLWPRAGPARAPSASRGLPPSARVNVLSVYRTRRGRTLAHTRAPIDNPPTSTKRLQTRNGLYTRLRSLYVHVLHTIHFCVGPFGSTCLELVHLSRGTWIRKRSLCEIRPLFCWNCFINRNLWKTYLPIKVTCPLKKISLGPGVGSRAPRIFISY